MVFSDSSGKTGLVEDASFLTFGDSLDHTTQYPLADITRNINRWYHRVVSWILQSQTEWDFDDLLNSNYPISTTNLVANQPDYTLPATAGVGNDRVLKIQRVDYTPDGTNWYKVEPIDQGEIGTAIDSASVANHFTSTQPYYDVRFNAIWLYPIPTTSVASGLRIQYLRRITDIFTTADTSQEPSFDEQFHRILSLGAAYDYCLANDQSKAAGLRGEIEALRAELTTFYGSKQEDRVMRLQVNRQNYK